MTTATLEPGDYVARLVVTDRDGATGTVVARSAFPPTAGESRRWLA